jgi:low affinity Fe/Cu permease
VLFGVLSLGFDSFAKHTSDKVGKPWAFILATITICAWAATGPLFHYSDTWQLVINTGTTVVTFLMVFLIQATQNRDSLAIQTKLDELIRATNEARNLFIGIDKVLTEEEIIKLREGNGETK